MRIEIWLAEKGNGYSAARIYESDVFVVASGNTHGFGGAPSRELFSVQMKRTDLTLYGGTTERIAFEQATDKDSYLFGLIIQHLTVERFNAILDSFFEAGKRAGRRELQDQFKALLTRED